MQPDPINQAVDAKLEEVAAAIERMPALGDTGASFAAFVRKHKTKCDQLGVCQDLIFPCKDCPRRPE